MRSSVTAGRARRILRAGLVALVLAAGPAAAGAMTVYKTASCGCCKDWVEHVRAAGFEVEARDVSRAQLIEHKKRLGVDPRMASCHTAVIDGYVVEGHVPAADIGRMLEESPEIAGIGVPGMPVGSPGMEVGDRTEPYTVIAFDGRGGFRAFARHGE